MSHLPDGADVLVLGGGLAGCAAALAAAEAGRSVILLEGESEVGGSTVLSAGLSAFAGTEEQAELGIQDSTELLKQDILHTGQWVNDPALVELYAQHQLATYRWLKSLGIRYRGVHPGAGQSVPRSHPTDPATLVHTLLARAVDHGATVVTRARAQRLITEAGRVGYVDVDGRRVAAAAVVLTTGGFSRNSELLARFAPRMRQAVRGGGAGSRGDGLLMAWQLGAGFVDTPYISGTYGIYPHPHPGEAGTGVLAVYLGAVAVNAEGNRFIDESLPYKVIGDASLAQPGGITYQIFDATVRAAADPDVPIYDLAARERNGLLVRADTLADLARRLGIPAGPLEATIARYNLAVSAREPDEFGRRTLCGGFGTPVPIAEPPFFAQPSSSVVLATYCGLTINTDCEVLDVFGEPIGGLLAAGEVIGGFHGAGYVTGTSIGKAAVLGRLAGQRAAQLAANR